MIEVGNGRFALTVEPGNAELRERVRDAERLREQGLPTVPTTVALEKAANPFLRPASLEIQRTLGVKGAGDVVVFARTRARKDAF